MKQICIALTVLCSLNGTLHAQERAAGGALDTQMTWTTLKSAIDNANTKSDGAHTRIDQIEACGKQGMVYAPGTADADSKGCISVRGRKDCPSGFTLVGDKNTAEAFCISSKAEPSKYWIDAVKGCYAKSPKAHLCTAAEWSTACVSGIKNMKSTGFEWLSGVVGNKYGAALIGGTTCGEVLTNASYPYQAQSRCCFR